MKYDPYLKENLNFLLPFLCNEIYLTVEKIGAEAEAVC
jgi:hypothetical protein